MFQANDYSYIGDILKFVETIINLILGIMHGDKKISLSELNLDSILQLF